MCRRHSPSCDDATQWSISDQNIRLLTPLPPSKWYTFLILNCMRAWTMEMRLPHFASLRAHEPYSTYQCLRTKSFSASSASTGKKSGRSPISRLTLVKNFAAQAVIAIENARLLDELRQRTDDLTQRTTNLTESLEQQTATSKVLDVISRSAFDLNAIFGTVAESSVRLCGADRAFIFRFDGDLLRMEVAHNASVELAEWVANHPIKQGRHSSTAGAALERRTIYILDVFADPEYTYGAKDVEAYRTVLSVPILKGDDLLGVITIYRLEVRPFTDKQIALVETFADQAAIAIENVRLLDELRQRTHELGRSVEELRALGEVSQAVNSTLELETVLSTIVANAVQLSSTEAGAIYVFDDRQREFHLRATYGMDEELIDALTQQRISLDEPNVAQALVRPEPVASRRLTRRGH